MATKASDAPTASSNALSGALADAVAQAASVKRREEPGEIVAGPFAVGEIGTVEVRKVTRGASAHMNAVFASASGKRSRVPLAAVAVLHEELGA